MTDQPKTPAEWRAALVTALRSGKYQQGKGFLRNSDKFSCLGVACDISGLGKWSEGSEGVRSYLTDDRLGNDRILPYPVAVRFGFYSVGGELDRSHETEDGRSASLDGLNDGGWSFQQIADLIEIGGVKVTDV